MAFITPAPCTPGGGGGGPEFDTEPIVLCDIDAQGNVLGSAIAVYKYDETTGMPIGAPTFVIPGTNTPYVPVGTLQPCDEPCVKCDTTVLCDNTQTPASEVVASTMVMMDTVNVTGDDGWNVTAFNTTNSPSTPQGTGCISAATPPVPVPYPAFYGDWCAAYLAACPSATAGGSGCSLNPGNALGVTADFESIGCAGGADFQTACARYTLEKTFNTDAACTKIRVTSQRFRADGSAKVLIDGQNTGIFGQYNQSSPDGNITLTLAPGPHVMTIDLRDSGSPTWIQGGLTIECLAITPAQTTSVQFLRTTCRTCTGKVLSVTDTTLDGQTPYVPGATVTVCDPGASNIPQSCASCESYVLADRVVGLSGSVSCISFLRRVCHNCDGSVSSVTDTLLDGTSPYTPTGNIGLGCSYPEDQELLCDLGNGERSFLRTYLKDPNGLIIATHDTDLNGNLYTVVGPASVCPTHQRDSEVVVLCDNTGAVFLRQYVYDKDALFVGRTDTLLDGLTPFVAANPVGSCDFSIDVEEEILCDNNGPFIRSYKYTNGVIGPPADFTFAGVAYVPVGTVVQCPTGCENTIELIGRCDYSGVPGALSFNSFFERLIWDCNGVLVSSDTITPTGTPYVPTGTVKTGLCDPEITQEILCDSNGTQFLRRYSWTDRQVGVNNIPLVRFDDFALDGTTAFAPVGAVSLCPVTTTVVTERDVEIVTLCDNNGGFLRRFVYDEATGLPTTVVTTDFAGNPYTTVGTVKVCDQTIAVTDLDAEVQFLCDNGTTTFIRRYVFNETTGAIGAVADFTLAGAAYVPAGPVTAGACVSASVPLANALDSTIQRQTGAGSIAVAAGARSVTLTVLSGAPTVTINGDPAVAVPVGVTLTWAVDDRDETLLEPFTFTGLAGDDFIVTTTRL